jgi:hypothetical protein
MPCSFTFSLYEIEDRMTRSTQFVMRQVIAGFSVKRGCRSEKRNAWMAGMFQKVHEISILPLDGFFPIPFK